MTDETEKQPEEAPMPPPGFSLIPTESITRLQEASATFKTRPVIREIAAGEPEVASALELLGKAVTGVIPGEKPDDTRALQSPEEQQQGMLAVIVLLGAGAGLMWAMNEKRKQQEEAEAAIAQQAAMRAAAEAQKQQGQQQQGQQYQRGG